jgi:hypothetical protein
VARDNKVEVKSIALAAKRRATHTSTPGEKWGRGERDTLAKLIQRDARSNAGCSYNALAELTNAKKKSVVVPQDTITARVQAE